MLCSLLVEECEPKKMISFFDTYVNYGIKGTKKQEKQLTKNYIIWQGSFK